ncbi:SCAN domain-containing protein 3 [Oopsacas minuta]|uniref:SCAN domain-containing protein 3 n=1 Tax=Oopsacas minuta TaxID=111878 RepID=A0AAV7JWR8_9METZ|nr:SCAN domain-containing protein 3 [Oopsacas minuta]
MINKITTKNDDGLVTSCKISLVIAKCGKLQTIGEKLILPAIREVISTVMHQDASNVVISISLSNNSVSRRIEELAIDVEQQLCKFYKQRNSLCSLMSQPYVTMKPYLWHMYDIFTMVYQKKKCSFPSH